MSTLHESPSIEEISDWGSNIWHVSIESISIEDVFTRTGHGGINSEFIEVVRDKHDFFQEDV